MILMPMQNINFYAQIKNKRMDLAKSSCEWWKQMLKRFRAASRGQWAFKNT